MLILPVILIKNRHQNIPLSFRKANKTNLEIQTEWIQFDSSSIFMFNRKFLQTSKCNPSSNNNCGLKIWKHQLLNCNEKWNWTVYLRYTERIILILKSYYIKQWPPKTYFEKKYSCQKLCSIIYIMVHIGTIQMKICKFQCFTKKNRAWGDGSMIQSLFCNWKDWSLVPNTHIDLYLKLQCLTSSLSLYGYPHTCAHTQGHPIHVIRNKHL